MYAWIRHTGSHAATDTRNSAAIAVVRCLIIELHRLGCRAYCRSPCHHGDGLLIRKSNANVNQRRTNRFQIVEEGQCSRVISEKNVAQGVAAQHLELS